MRVTIDTTSMTLKKVKDNHIYNVPNKRIVLILEEPLEKLIGKTIYTEFEEKRPPLRYVTPEMANLKHMIITQTQPAEPQNELDQSVPYLLSTLIEVALAPGEHARGQGRPAKYKDSRNITLRGPGGILKEYEKVAQQEGRTRNAILIEALQAYLVSKGMDAHYLNDLADQ